MTFANLPWVLFAYIVLIIMFQMGSEATYICSFDEATLKVSKADLNEDPKNRQGAIDILREWIRQQKNLTFTTGTVCVSVHSFLFPQKFVAVFLHCCPDCPSYPDHTKELKFATCTTASEYSHPLFHI